MSAAAINDLPNRDSAKSATYSVHMDDYRRHNGVEDLLMLGLSHKSDDSAVERTNWIYKNNPAGKARVFIVKHNDSGQDVGLLTLCRRQIWTPKETINAGIFCDLVTDKSHRTLGPALSLMKAAGDTISQSEFGRLYGWPNDKSVVLYKRLPAVEPGKINIYRRYLDWSSVLQSRMPKIPATILGSAIKVIDSTVLKIKQVLIKRSYSIQHDVQFTSMVDEVWSAARHRFSEIGVRDREFLNWRFLHNPDCEHRIFSLYSKDGNTMKGYVVYRELTSESIEIGDFLAIDDKSTERDLLTAFNNFVKSTQYKKISLLFSGTAETTKNLHRCGFIRVGDRATMSVSQSPQKSGIEVRTHVTQADHDIG